jgi:hypothetical protein
MVSMKLTAELPGVTLGGENVAVAPAGSPLAAKETVPVNDPFSGVTTMV